MTPEFPPHLVRAIALAARATTQGYRLVRLTPTPYTWQLLDALDQTPIYTADSLDDIETWLNT
ncbi:hypothetical protein [Nocardia macrotermitis]|uniref:Uncharacterized protein n=1 Tax=Nocardia macrotermitis TaxID=2585198 RepID=A0A7K0CYM6_9NOCA|nr:hypothetical protein [Nocardia macrotermitis]MQY18573.1 hypothetical protein [Nocardia macrotermitis]